MRKRCQGEGKNGGGGQATVNCVLLKLPTTEAVLLLLAPPFNSRPPPLSDSMTMLLLSALLLLALLASASADPLFAALASVPFDDALLGVSNNADTYGLHSVSCYYLEVENVSCTSCSWGGKCQLQTLQVGPPPPTASCLNRSSAQANVDRPGGDMSSAPATSYDACSDRCCADSSCLGWVYVTTLQSKTDEDECKSGGPCCWLKGELTPPNPISYPGGLWSGSTSQPPPPPVTVPPTGIRDAVPVGGLGAGTLELRGDGTFHEITIHSASPAGSAKVRACWCMCVQRWRGGVAGAMALVPPHAPSTRR